MINVMPPFCMRILKQQLGTGLEEPASFVPPLAAAIPHPAPAPLRPPPFLNVTSFLIYNEKFLSIRPEMVTKV